ncbi:uncharacterized protein LOC141680614 [Apium graveolens]|uniref:uncharacterized protein LOC141680614 n=1 Tax=Apium graveolens TaxID=4045 RepID=UPI003D7A75C7
MGGEEGDKFFNLEDLNADYGRKYRRTKQLNRNKENVVIDSAVADRCALSSSTGKEYDHSTRVNRINGQRSYSVNQDEPITPVHPSNSMLTESTPNIVRLVGKRRKLGDLPRSDHLNEIAAKCSSPIVTPRSNSRVNYMNPLEGSQDKTPLSDVTNSGSASFSRNMLRETRSNINDVSLNGREPLNQKGKENYLGFGRELFADEIVSDDEEESNDFNEGPNVVAPLFLSDDSEGSDYETSDCESSDDADCLSWSLDGDDEDIVDGMNSDCNLMQSRRAPRRVVPEEYASLGGPTAICSKCHARMWKKERVNKNMTKGCPIFSLCCMKGAVRLPPIPPTPEYFPDLYNDKKRGPTFHRLIRLYNAIFAFTSTGGNIDHSINNGRVPYVNRLNVDNRLRWISVHDRESVDKEVVRGLITMLDETNQLVGEFRHQRDLYESDEIVKLQITLKVIRSESGRECHISSTDEVAGIMVGDTEEICGDRDIVVNEKGKGLVRVSYVHPKLMALQYPLFFPRGEDGFHPKIKFQKTADSSCKPRGFMSLKNYYSYTFQIRESDGTKMMEYVSGCIAPNCPDIISMVFRLKLDQLMVDIKDKKHFGVCIGVMYVVEFLKRGLPHVHMLIWLDADSKKTSSRMWIILYCARTTFDDSGFPMYMRRMINITVEIRKAEVDNQWVVPYNRDLLVKYQCHMNVEICCHARSFKYLFKYCLKGHDRTTVHVQRNRKRQANDTDEGGIDEINTYFDGRYLCGAESAYRIFGFPIHHRSISVERLQFHLSGDKNCTFRANEALGKVVARDKNKFSKLEAFFYLNSVDINARKYTYDEIPRFYVWNDGERKWTMRKRGFQIGKLCYVHHSTGEPWFLRLLLMKVHGATSFESLRTVNGVCYSTFRDACKEYGLHDDDKEWHEVLTQASAGGLPPQFYVLGEIDELLRSVGKSLKKFDQLPQSPRSYLNNGTNNLIIEETSYDTRKMEYETAKLLQDCTEEQRKIYDAWGLWKDILMENSYIYCATHKADTTNNMGRGAYAAQVAFECLDQSLKDIMKAVDPERYAMSFGGITVVLGGDFRQILPVITYGDRADIVAACITRSRLWSICQVFLLT